MVNNCVWSVSCCLIGLKSFWAHVGGMNDHVGLFDSLARTYIWFVHRHQRAVVLHTLLPHANNSGGLEVQIGWTLRRFHTPLIIKHLTASPPDVSLNSRTTKGCQVYSWDWPKVFQHDHQEHEQTSSSSTSLIFMAVFLQIWATWIPFCHMQQNQEPNDKRGEKWWRSLEWSL